MTWKGDNGTRLFSPRLRTVHTYASASCHGNRPWRPACGPWAARSGCPCAQTAGGSCCRCTRCAQWLRQPPLPGLRFPEQRLCLHLRCQKVDPIFITLDSVQLELVKCVRKKSPRQLPLVSPSSSRPARETTVLLPSLVTEAVQAEGATVCPAAGTPEGHAERTASSQPARCGQGNSLTG